jgi:hypothetical protein
MGNDHYSNKGENAMRHIVSRSKFIETINELSRINPSRWYRLCFKRATPKCPICGTKNAKWKKDFDVHCVCGGTIEYEANVMCHIRTITDGTFKYFDQNNKMKNCVFKNIRWISYNVVDGDNHEYDNDPDIMRELYVI